MPYGVAMRTNEFRDATASHRDVINESIERHARSPGGLGAWLRAARAPVYARLCASYVAPEHWREIVLYLIDVAGGLAVDAIEERPELAMQHLDPGDLEPLLAAPAADVRQAAMLLLGAVRTRFTPASSCRYAAVCPTGHTASSNSRECP